MPKLKTNVFVEEKGRRVLRRKGENIPRDAVRNKAVFADEPQTRAGVRRQPDPPAEGENLDNMNVNDLRQLGQARGVDLSGASRKEEIIARLRAAQPRVDSPPPPTPATAQQGEQSDGEGQSGESSESEDSG